MKTTHLVTAILALSLSGASARTWTSSDGSKTFEGDLRSYNPTTGQVSVVVNGRVLNFSQDKLSEADITFLKKSGSSGSTAAATDTESEIGAKVAKAKLQKLDGKRYRRAEIEKAPKYYILYYSASW